MSRKLSASLFIFPLCLLTGCAAGEKTAGLTVVYGAAAVLALLLLMGYCGAVRKKNLWIGVLFASVTVVNLGYFLLACPGIWSRHCLPTGSPIWAPCCCRWPC